MAVYVGLTIWLSTSNGWRVLAGPDFVDCFELRPCLRLCSLDQDCQSGFSLWRLRGIFGSLVRSFSAPVEWGRFRVGSALVCLRTISYLGELAGPRLLEVGSARL